MEVPILSILLRYIPYNLTLYLNISAMVLLSNTAEKILHSHVETWAAEMGARRSTFYLVDDKSGRQRFFIAHMGRKTI